MAISNARNGYINGTTSGWVARSLFNVGDTLYAVVLNTSAVVIEVHKSTDGGVTWTEQDSGDSLAHSGATHSYDANMPLSGSEAGFIYVAYRTASTTVRVRRFDTSTDTWEATDLGSANASTVVQSDFGMGLVVRSNGDVVILYRNSTNQDTYITKYESGAWSISTVRTTATTVALCATMTANSDMAHLMIHETTNGDVHHRSVDSGSSLGTIGTLDATSITTIWYSSFMGYVNDGGTHRLGFANWDSTGELDFLYTTSSATPTFTTVGSLSPTSTTDPGKMGGTVVGYNGQWHVIWSGNGRGSIHYDVSDDYASPAFGADTTPVTGLANDPAVYAIAAPTGVPVLYTDHTTPSVDLFWAAGAPASTGATGTVTGDTVPVVGGSVTGTAGTGATGTVTGDTVAVTGGSVTGTAGSAGVDATGTVLNETTYTNYMPNPSAEVDEAEWDDFTFVLGGSATVASSTEQAYVGTHSIKVTCVTASDLTAFGFAHTGVVLAISQTLSAGDVSGNNLAYSVRARSGTGTSGNALEISDGDISTFSTGIALSTSWTGETHTYTSSSDFSGFFVFVECTNGETFYLDAAYIAVNEPLPPGDYGDGDTAGWSWSGTPDDSSSSITISNAVVVEGGTVSATAGLGATATVTGDNVPLAYGSITATAGTGATGTVTGDTIPVVGGSVTGTGDTVADATGTVSVDNVPITGGTVSATAGTSDTATVTADTVPITGGSVSATAGLGDSATVTGDTIPITGGTVTGTGQVSIIPQGVVTGTAGYAVARITGTIGNAYRVAGTMDRVSRITGVTGNAERVVGTYDRADRITGTMDNA
jgi:hypothetical protein